ncbi:hypothetical protein ABEX38_29125 [Priestia megaterium]
MEIYLQQQYAVIGTIHMKEAGEYSFNFPFEGKCEISVTDSHLTVNAVFSIEEIITDRDLDQMAPDFKKVVDNNLDIMRQHAFYLINLLKYSLNNGWITEELLKVISITISIDNLNWHEFPLKSVLQSGPSTSPRYLTQESSIIIQQYIDDKIEPFVALKHLQKARKEEVPRHMWIEATIAAELAIKEFLIRKITDIEFILLELPSPPLNKLYGRVLENYIGEAYPKYNKLGEGATTRNHLIHRPKETDITYDKAVKYVQLVEDAIYFLLRKLYPGDPIINSSMVAQIQLKHVEQ